MYWRNKKFLGVAFKNIDVGENRAYFPGVSLERGMRVVFNFGLHPFSQTLHPVVISINEPECLVNNYITVSAILVDQFRNFILAFSIPEFRHLSSDERLFVGSIILEYMLPLLADDYVFESLLMEMMKQLLILGKSESLHMAFMAFETLLPFNQFRQFIERVVKVALS
jgi:hypothetical protein